MKFRDLSLYCDEELALCVWAGFFGEGAERKNKLGNRYAAVQDIVNKQGRTQLIEPINKVDLDALTKAVKTTYDEAADELIELIEKELEK